MPLFTRYKGGSVYHVLPTGGERRADRKIVSAGLIDIALCGADPVEVAHEYRPDPDGPPEPKLCKACIKASLRLNTT